MNFFVRPTLENMARFFQFHPVQDLKQIPRQIQNTFETTNGTNIKWLSYCSESASLFRTVCLAFAPTPHRTCTFVDGGISQWRHIHQRVAEHSSTEFHRDSDSDSELPKLH